MCLGRGLTVGNWSIWSDSPWLSVNLGSRSSSVGQSAVLSTSASLQPLSEFRHPAYICARVCVCLCVLKRGTDSRCLFVCVCASRWAPASVYLHVALLHPTHSIHKISLGHANTISRKTLTHPTRHVCVCVCGTCVCVCVFSSSLSVTFTGKWTLVPENPNDTVNCFCHP